MLLKVCRLKVIKYVHNLPIYDNPVKWSSKKCHPIYLPHERDSGLRKIFAKYALLKDYPKNALQNKQACIARMSDQLSAENEISLLTIWNA